MVQKNTREKDVMFDTAKCYETIEECAEFLGLAPEDYAKIRSALSDDGLTFTASFYDADDILIGEHTVNVGP